MRTTARRNGKMILDTGGKLKIWQEIIKHVNNNKARSNTNRNIKINTRKANWNTD